MGRIFRTNPVSLAALLSGLSLIAALMLCVSCSVSQTEPQQSLETGNEADDNVLDAEQRQFLWDVEHQAFVLEQKVFPVFKAAIAEGHVAALSEYLTKDFFAYVDLVSTEDAHEVPQGSPIQIRELSRADNSRRVDGNEFLEFLKSYRGQFAPEATDCSVRIGLVRLGPVDRSDLSSQWKGLWRIRMAGTNGAAPLELTMDLSGELDPLDDDLPSRRQWIKSAVVERLRLVSSEQPLMEEVTTSSGMEPSHLHDNWRDSAAFKANTGGVYLCDFDQDGCLDALVEDVEAGITLYRAGRTLCRCDGASWVTRLVHGQSTRLDSQLLGRF